MGGHTIRLPERTHWAYDVRGILTMLALAGVYLAVAWAGLQFTIFHKNSSPVWPASGVALAALMVLGVSRWPGIFLGAVLCALVNGDTLFTGVGVATGNTLAAVLGALLLRRLGVSVSLRRLQDVVALIVGGALLCTQVSALIGTASTCLLGSVPWEQFWRTAGVWWGGDALGVIVVAPVLLLRPVRPLERRWEAVALAVAILLVCAEVFLDGAVRLPFAYLETLFFFPLVVWAALRFSTRGTAFTTLLITVLSVLATVSGLGPFAQESLPTALLLVQLIVAINAVTGLLLAAVSAERHSALARLELLATAVRGVSEGVVISEVSPEGPRVAFANEAFRSMVGRPLEALVGRSPSEHFGKLDPETHERLDASLREAGPFRGEVLLTRPDGTWVRSELQHSPVRDGGGAVTHLVSIHRDVTATEELRARLLAAERVATVGMLAAGVGHEINNPLAYLGLNLETALRGLSRDMGLKAETVASLRGAQEATERIRRIVQDLRMFSREGSEEHARVDLREVVKPALRMTRHLLRERARLVESYEAVPHVLGSEARLGQVLVNLLVNAMQAIPEGSPERNEVRVFVDTAPDGRARVRVEDTGLGILPEVLPHIFEPFFTTKSHAEGTGLGLSISQQIVRSHGGEVLVSSESGKGSVFTVLLPAASAPVAGALPHYALPSPVEGARRGRILIIDDEPRLALSMRLLLSPHHDVVVTTRGSEALGMVSSGQRFDAVVCDLQMPDMTGMDVYARLSTEVPELARRLVFISGGACTPTALNFIRHVRNPVLEKPVHPSLLLSTIDEALAPVPFVSHGDKPPV
ncbi:MASE1 domain-containing protein [Hyalangium rubrum]|uniref:histidine kinase n=1 Tax=Hyalangium rubrum TaxID=3103134 RepID=A0ABU5HFP7_9BACT|nr:MASE1 domain-containing protein [Hyalangium sp. s54d21]MDY7232296.1 MASE1 domain-containing protein [Hyalangium sp. s54d21]